MKLLVTGASGLLGAAVTRRAAEAGHEVLAVVGRWAGAVPGATRVVAVDLAQPERVDELVRAMRPDVIVHAAAIAEPAACDAAPELSQRLNVELPAALAAAAVRSQARLLHVSSEQVFDGEGAPYAAGDAARPLNLYGAQKLAAERRVLNVFPQATLVRIPLLLGDSLGGRRSVHEKLLESWHRGEVTRLYVDEVRQVCSADSVAAVLLGLAARPELHGVFHWAGAQPITRFELGRLIAQRFGVNEHRIVATRRDETPAVSAKRPRDLSLQIEPLARALALPPESLADAVAALHLPAWADAERT